MAVSPDLQHIVCSGAPGGRERMHMKNACGEVVSRWEADSELWASFEMVSFCWPDEGTLVAYNCNLGLHVFEAPSWQRTFSIVLDGHTAISCPSGVLLKSFSWSGYCNLLSRRDGSWQCSPYPPDAHLWGWSSTYCGVVAVWNDDGVIRLEWGSRSATRETLSLRIATDDYMVWLPGGAGVCFCTRDGGACRVDF